MGIIYLCASAFICGSSLFAAAESRPAEEAMAAEARRAYQVELARCKQPCDAEFRGVLKTYLAKAQSDYDEKFGRANDRLGKAERKSGKSSSWDRLKAEVKTLQTTLAAAKRRHGQSAQAGVALQRARDGFAEVRVHCKYGLIDRAVKAYRASLTQFGVGLRTTPPVKDSLEGYAALAVHVVAAHEQALVALVGAGNWVTVVTLLRDSDKQHEAVCKTFPDGDGFGSARGDLVKAGKQLPRSIGAAWKAAPPSSDPAVERIAERWIRAMELKGTADGRR